MFNRLRLILTLFFIFSFSAGAGEILEGRVVGVLDGDTVTLLMVGIRFLSPHLKFRIVVRLNFNFAGIELDDALEISEQTET